VNRPALNWIEKTALWRIIIYLQPEGAPMHLKPEVSDRIKRCLVEQLDPVRIVIFGSYATGEADQESDVDIMAIVANGRPSDRQTAIQGRIALRKVLRGEGLAFDLLVESEHDFDRAKFQNGTIEHAVFRPGIVIHEQ
jgi:predicted nucleotidyltransferase